MRASKEEMTGPGLGSTFAAALHDGLSRYGSLRTWRETPAPPVASASPAPSGSPAVSGAPAASAPAASAPAAAERQAPASPGTISVAAVLEEALPPWALAAVAGVLLESTARQMLEQPGTAAGDEALRALGMAQVLGYATTRGAAGVESAPPPAVSAALRTVRTSLEAAVGNATGAARA
ncbi:hypothetical protein [Streptomyces sp. NPDC008001]|uniref:hypothetical protein n=1 Tax=Streptomyces sp. NPDC008001 TaxID=3364804 RepID=UPI0036ED9857